MRGRRERAVEITLLEPSAWTRITADEVGIGSRLAIISPMQRSIGGARDDLRSIAHRVMLERGLEPDFSAAAKRETERITRAAADPTVRDMRDLLWASIDNDDSRDLDQLTVSVPDGNGATRILVAVADVDALIVARSAIDEHAQTNTTSVYTAAEVFPMLPEKFSTDLTSLNQDQDRLA
ncbi:MAG TPA: RNB domain-containing ribonuclease, partial [Casimicrobiaceae bacterium]|nr:RNB domain-containing ribonuclease [Casimicrobiaceae bacterium]